MSTEEVLRIVEERGLKIGIVQGRPVLLGAARSPAVTDRLLAVLRIHRERIVERLLELPGVESAGISIRSPTSAGRR